ncbi:MAG TPA: potassium-transporting ATPase subunit KdpC [Bryobacteraceae bacterium]|nr:potassium-transporting ATPase subunit KdpC [Bryobacteraceae bacterium]
MKQLLIAVRATAVLAILTGVLYPLAVTGLAKLFFPYQANGSMLPAGSALIGQKFTRPEYFHGRLPDADDGLASGGPNLGPTNQSLATRVAGDVKKFREENPTFSGPVPADLVTASGSGLDPDISPAGAEAQIGRVAAARHAGADAVRALVAANTEGPQYGIFGEPRINALKLNLALDRAFPVSTH